MGSGRSRQASNISGAVAARSLPHLQLQLDAFRSHYNQERPHRALAGGTPLKAFNARIKAKPEQPLAPTH